MAASQSIDIAETGTVISSGPLSSPKRARPRSHLYPPYPVPEVGANIPTMNCGRSVDAKRLQLRILWIVAARPHALWACAESFIRGLATHATTDGTCACSVGALGMG